MKKELWLRLKGYHFDHLVPAHLTDHVAAAFGGPDASTKAFASKLARKLGWSTPFALRAIDEYKKFVYLGIVGDFSVTPPKLIDQVWHEHLLFSRAYREFCTDILHRDFDHNPELVATDTQTDTFQAQYVATLELYKAEFNTRAPADIWGTPKFNRDAAAVPDRKPRQRPDTSTYAGDPLYLYFDSSSGGHTHSHASMPEFGGGGGFAGAGSEGSWGGDSHSHSDASGHSDGSSGDGGSGDGGGSGCSSSCGGGGCGGS